MGVFAATYHLVPAFVAAQEGDHRAMQDFLDQTLAFTERGAGTVDFVPNVALPAAELLERDNPDAAAQLATALHGQTFTTPLHYHRYRQLRDRLPEQSPPQARLSPSELHGLATRLLHNTYG